MTLRLDQIDLLRTFSIAKDYTEDSDDYLHYFGRRTDNNQLTWKNLHEKPVTVVVGEAGIGKTIEFKNEVQRMRQSGKFAFFIPLNELDEVASWELAFELARPAYERWKSSLEEGYFFLDAIDEARLTDHAAFKKALAITLANLKQHLDRVYIAISSRWTDWLIDDVRATVNDLLVAPIATARRTAKMLPDDEFSEEPPSVQVKEQAGEEEPETFVVKLEPLARSEANRLAEAWSVTDPHAFWAAIDDGQYDYMASRPLDLRWMVTLWNQKHSLGTYLELIEGNVTNRLTEINPSYQASGAVLSADQLRKGAEELAAAAVFSGRAFVSMVSKSSPSQDEVAPTTLLTDWTVTEISRLLASAVFDEATFGRVKFHHRSAREYLSACWVNRQLEAGLPLHRVLPLFAATPFGETVLISARRWTLCWLVSINVKVREWTIRHAPEMFFFDGDPESWDALSAEQAFSGYVQRLKEGLRTDWYNDVSEFKRVGRCLKSGSLIALLTDPQLPGYVKTDLLPIIKHAHLTDCADAIFSIYKSQTTPPHERRYTLEVLETIAQPKHRELIKVDLLSGVLKSNELLASALAAADWKNLTVDELTQVFTTASSEDSYGAGPMAQSIKYDLLPAATADSATLLLEAVLSLLPQPEEMKQLPSRADSDQPERAWLLDVIPACFERLLELLPTTIEAYPTVYFKAAKYIEALRYSDYSDREDLSRINGLIVKHPRLRWQLGLAIAQNPNSLLTIGPTECIVSFDGADLPELTRRANDMDSSPDERNVWFSVADEIAFRYLRSTPRKTALRALETGPDSEARTKKIIEHRGQLIKSSQLRRSWKAKDRQRKREQVSKHKANRDKLHADIQHIRDATSRGALSWLIRYSYNHSSGRRSLTRVDFGVIAKDFGQDIADALAAGLKVVWLNSDTPNPADNPDGTVPWAALAGLQMQLAEGLEIAELDGEEASRAARLAVWEINSPPSWFEPLADTHSQVVFEALQPWICSEAQSEMDTHRPHSALGMALHCPSNIRSMLLRPLVAMISGGSIKRSDTFRAVVDALRKDGLIDQKTTAELCHARLVASTSKDGLIGEIHWLRTWMEEDILSAWTWFEAHIEGHDTTADALINEFTEAMDDCNWVKTPTTTPETVEVLLRLHALLSKHLPPPDSPVAAEDQTGFRHSIAQFRQAIPRVLVQIQGATAHRALSQLAAAEVDTQRKNWLNNCIREHASLEASQSAHLEPSDLRTIGSPFLTEPRNETQLYQQVVGRLEEIRKSLEEGPFSDRDLFTTGMPEKKLQLWLAARFQDTQNRRFGVHREEVVDADNRTDIQLSFSKWNVCIEIKPIDAERGYSANSLTKTLQEQIVDQYLKGYNSSHGILVLFRLDKKTWDIPGGARIQPFSALEAYLKEQALQIKEKSPGVDELIVFGIDCTVPTK